MKNNKTLKSFESYMSPEDDNIKNPKNSFTDEEVNARIKSIITGMIETTQYFKMLKDSTESVFGMIYGIIPENAHGFANELYKKNDFLAELVEEIMTTLGSSSMLDDLEQVVANLQKVHDLTEDNWDNVLSGESEFEEDEDEDEDEDLFIDDDLDEDEGEEIDVPKKDDSKDQHNLPLAESIKKIEDLEKFVKKYSKSDKFRKGDIVYLGGISTQFAKKLNGKKAEIVKKCDDKEDCYDLFVSSVPFKKKGDANVKGMPAKFIHNDKIDENISFRNTKLIRK